MKNHTKNVVTILGLITLFLTLIIALMSCRPGLPQASASTSPPERASQPTLISHPPESTISPKAVDLDWDNSPASLIIRYYSPYTTAGLAGAYNHAYYVPEAQIWGDGRILWVTYEGSTRHLLVGQLTTEQMTALLQRLVEADFFKWQEEYATLGGNSTPPMRLAVSLTGKAKEVEEHGGAPQAYYDFVAWLIRGAGAEGRAYAPEQGYLTAACWPDIEMITPGTIWPDADAGFSLDQVGQGRYIEGEILALAWQAVNQNPRAPVYVKSNQQDCTIMVQIPGVSFVQSPPATTPKSTPTIPPTLSPTLTQTPLSTPTPDLVEIVIAMSQPAIHATYPSPDRKSQAEVVIHGCVQVNEGDVVAYEQLKLIQVSDGTKKIADSQLQYCGGLGAYGFEGLFWAPNNRYFYYTNAREGVPDGCGYWERPIIRFDVTNESVDYLGGGPVSPNGSKIATWQDRELVIWDINQGEIGRAAAVVQNVGPGSIVWSPDSQALVYVQVTTYCPLSGKSYLVRLDLPELKPDLLFESDMPTFGGIIWDAADQIRLFDEKNQEWTYNFAAKELKPSS